MNVDRHCPVFAERLAQQHQTRLSRATRIGEKLATCGFADVQANVMAQVTDTNQITRAHFAKALVANGHVKDHAQAFKQWLGKGKRAYVAAKWITIEEAILWIEEAGGQAVLAHPSHYDMTTKWLRRLVAYFAENGGQGIEVNYPNLTPDKQRLLIEIANDNGRFGSVGSDFHYPSRWTELGRRASLPDGIDPIWHDWTIQRPHLSEDRA